MMHYQSKLEQGQSSLGVGSEAVSHQGIDNLTAHEMASVLCFVN